MSTYTVTRARKETAPDGTHQHIAGVCSDQGSYYSRGQVVISIHNGDNWITSAGGRTARIHVIARCPKAGVRDRALYHHQPGRHHPGQPRPPTPLLIVAT
jgi:hypothetical protein